MCYLFLSHLVISGRAAKGQCNMRCALVLLVKGYRPGTSVVKMVGKGLGRKGRGKPVTGYPNRANSRFWTDPSPLDRPGTSTVKTARYVQNAYFTLRVPC